MSTERNWSSLRPNENYLDTLLSGTFGNPPAGSFDREAYEEARTTASAFFAGPTPWKGMTNGTVVSVKDGLGYNRQEHAVIRHGEEVWTGCGNEVWAEEATREECWRPRANLDAATPEPEAIAARPLEALPEVMDAKAINVAYEEYQADRKGNSDKFKAALFAYAPKDTRLQQCEKFIRRTGQ